MENNKQQTAIQEMIDELDYDLKASGVFVNWEFYLQMEKEQIINAHKAGNKYNEWALQHEHEQYYNETYGKE